jgi:hypothetical protein
MAIPMRASTTPCGEEGKHEPFVSFNVLEEARCQEDALTFNQRSNNYVPALRSNCAHNCVQTMLYSCSTPSSSNLFEPHISPKYHFQTVPSLTVTPSKTTVPPTTAQKESTNSTMTQESGKFPRSQPPNKTCNASTPPYPQQDTQCLAHTSTSKAVEGHTQDRSTLLQ